MNPSARYISALLILVTVLILLQSCGGSSSLMDKKDLKWTELKEKNTFDDPNNKGQKILDPLGIDSPHLLGMPDASDYSGTNGPRIRIWFDRVILDGPTIPKKHMGRRANVVLNDDLELKYYITGEPDEGSECKTPHTRLGNNKAATASSSK